MLQRDGVRVRALRYALFDDEQRDRRRFDDWYL
jgi:hypothetical protein